MGYNNVDVMVSGPNKPSSTYKTKILKGNHSFASQVTEANTKYVIKYDFDLEGAEVTIPANCILEFDGGSISNGTLIGQNTILIYHQELEDAIKDTHLDGTFIYKSGAGIPDDATIELKDNKLQVKNGGIHGIHLNADVVDDEDIHLTTDNKLQFKDRPNTDGMGRVILRKNMVSSVNTLTQSMVNQTNTIYIIQYDFILGENVTIPANCVLQFEGGSISASSDENMNTITGTNTEIKAGLIKIFETNLTINGTWNVIEIYPEWFGAKGDGVTDDTNMIQKSIYLSYCTNQRSPIVLSKNYAVTQIVINDNEIHLVGSISSGKAKLVGIQANTTIIYITGVSQGTILENFTITANYEGIVGIFSEAVCRKYQTAGLWYAKISNIRFNNCDVAIKMDARDDRVENNNKDVANQYFIINNCKVHGTKNIDIYLIGQIGQNSIKDCYFEYSNSRNYYIYIDTNTTSNSDGSCPCFKNCSFVGNPDKVVIYATGRQYSNIEFHECWFEAITKPFVTSKIQSGIIFRDCYYNNCNGSIFAQDCASKNRIRIEGGIPFSSRITNAYDSITMDKKSCNIICNNGLIGSFFRDTTEIIRAGENCPTAILDNPTYIQDANDGYSYCSLKVNLYKHSSYSYNIVGIKQGDTTVGYFRLGQTINLIKQSGTYFPVQQRQIPLYGTSSERNNVINTADLSIGFQYFDTTLGKPIYWNGTAWVDATGATV